MDISMKTKIDQRAEVVNSMKEELIKRLNLPYTQEDMHEDISLFGAGLGLDSLDALEVVLCVENCFKIKIPDNDPSILRSINTLVDYVLSQKQKQEGGR